MEFIAVKKKMKEYEVIFPWLKKVRKRLLKSFCEENTDDQLLLQQHLYEEFQTLLCDKDKMRVEAFYEIIRNFYLHFIWRVNWNKDYPMKFSCVQLLYYMVLVGLVLSNGDITSHWMDQVLTVLKSFPGDAYLMFDALLLIQNLKKKYHQAYALILKHILCTEIIKNPSDSESYMKVLLLFRRLKCFSKSCLKESTISSAASKVKCPPGFVNWMSLNIGNFSSLSCENAAEDFLKIKLKSKRMKKIFQVLFKDKYDEKFISPVKLQKDGDKIKPSSRKFKISKLRKQNLKISKAKSVKFSKATFRDKIFNNDKYEEIDDEFEQILPSKCNTMNRSSVSILEGERMGIKDEHQLKQQSKNQSGCHGKDKDLETSSIIFDHSTPKSKQSRKRIRAQNTTSPITLLLNTSSVSPQQKKRKSNKLKHSEISIPLPSLEIDNANFWHNTQEEIGNKMDNSIDAYVNYSNAVSHSFSLIGNSSKHKWCWEDPEISNTTLASDLQHQDSEKVSNNELNHVRSTNIKQPLILPASKSNTESFTVPLYDGKSACAIGGTIEFAKSSDIEINVIPSPYESINSDKVPCVFQRVSSKETDETNNKSSGKNPKDIIHNPPVMVVKSHNTEIGKENDINKCEKNTSISFPHCENVNNTFYLSSSQETQINDMEANVIEDSYCNTKESISPYGSSSEDNSDFLQITGSQSIYSSPESLNLDGNFCSTLDSHISHKSKLSQTIYTSESTISSVSDVDTLNSADNSVLSRQPDSSSDNESASKSLSPNSVNPKCSKLSSSVISRKKRSRKQIKSREIIPESNSDSSDQNYAGNSIKTSPDILNDNVCDSSLNLQLKCSSNSDVKIFQERSDKSSLSLKKKHSESVRSFNHSNSDMLKFSSESLSLGEMFSSFSESTSYLSVKSAKIPKSKEFISESDTNSSKDLNNLQNNFENKPKNFHGENGLLKIQSEGINNSVPSEKNPKIPVNSIDKFSFCTQSKSLQSIHSASDSLTSSQSLFSRKKNRSSKLQKSCEFISESDSDSCHDLNVSSNKIQRLLINSGAEDNTNGSSVAIQAKSVVSNTLLSETNSHEVISDNYNDETLHSQSLVHSNSDNSKSPHEINVSSPSAKIPCINSRKKSSKVQNLQNFLSVLESNSLDMSLSQNKIQKALNDSDAESNSSFPTFEIQPNSCHLDKTSLPKNTKENSTTFVSESSRDSSQINEICATNGVKNVNDTSQINEICTTDGLENIHGSNEAEIKAVHEMTSIGKPDSCDSDSEFHSVSTSDCDTYYVEKSSRNTNSKSLVKEVSISNESCENEAYSHNQRNLYTYSPKLQKLSQCNSLLENNKDFRKESLPFERNEDILLNDSNSECCQTLSEIQNGLKIKLITSENYVPIKHSLDSNSNSYENQAEFESLSSCADSNTAQRLSKLPKLWKFIPESESNSLNDSQHKIQNTVNDSKYISGSPSSKIHSKSHFSDKIGPLKKKRYTKKKTPKTPRYISESDSDVTDTDKILRKNELEKKDESTVPEMKVPHEKSTLETHNSHNSDSHSVVTSDNDANYLDKSCLVTNSKSLVEEVSTSNESSEIQVFPDNQQNQCALSPKSEKLSHCNLLLENNENLTNKSPTFERKETLLHDSNGDLYNSQTPSKIQKGQEINFLTSDNYLPEQHSQDSNGKRHENQTETDRLSSYVDLDGIRRSSRLRKKPQRYMTESERDSLNDLSLSQNKLHNHVNDSSGKYNLRSTLKIQSKTVLSNKTDNLKKDGYTQEKPSEKSEHTFESDSDFFDTNNILMKNVLEERNESTVSEIKGSCVTSPLEKPNCHNLDSEFHSVTTSDCEIGYLKESSLKSNIRPVTEESFLESNTKPLTEESSLNSIVRAVVKESPLKSNTRPMTKESSPRSNIRTVTEELSLKSNTKPVSNESSLNAGMECLNEKSSLNTNTMNDSNAEINPSDSKSFKNRIRYFKWRQKSTPPLVSESDSDFVQITESYVNKNMRHLVEELPLNTNTINNSADEMNPGLTLKNHLNFICFDETKHSKKIQKSSPLVYESDWDSSHTNKILTVEGFETISGSNTMEVNELQKMNESNVKEIKKLHEMSSCGKLNFSSNKSSHSSELDSVFSQTNEVLTGNELEKINHSNSMDSNNLENKNESSVTEVEKSFKTNSSRKSNYKRRPALLVYESDSDSSSKTNEIITKNRLEKNSDSNSMETSELGERNGTSVKEVEKLYATSSSGKPNYSLDKSSHSEKRRSTTLVSESDSDFSQTNKLLQISSSRKSNYKRRSAPFVSESDSDSSQTNEIITKKGLEKRNGTNVKEDKELCETSSSNCSLDKSSHSKRRRRAPLVSESASDSSQNNKILTEKISDSDSTGINELVKRNGSNVIEVKKLLEISSSRKSNYKRRPALLESESDSDSSLTNEIITKNGHEKRNGTSVKEGKKNFEISPSNCSLDKSSYSRKSRPAPLLSESDGDSSQNNKILTEKISDSNSTGNNELKKKNRSNVTKVKKLLEISSSRKSNYKRRPALLESESDSDSSLTNEIITKNGHEKRNGTSVKEGKKICEISPSNCSLDKSSYSRKSRPATLLSESDGDSSQNNKILTEKISDSNSTGNNELKKKNRSNVTKVKKLLETSSSRKSNYKKRPALFLSESDSDKSQSDEILTDKGEHEKISYSSSIEINGLEKRNRSNVTDVKKSLKASNCNLDKSCHSKKRKSAVLVSESDSDSFQTNEILAKNGLEKMRDANSMEIEELKKKNVLNITKFKKMSKIFSSGKSKSCHFQKRKLKPVPRETESNSDSSEILSKKRIEKISDSNDMEINELEKRNGNKRVNDCIISSKKDMSDKYSFIEGDLIKNLPNCDSRKKLCTLQSSSEMGGTNAKKLFNINLKSDYSRENASYISENSLNDVSTNKQESLLEDICGSNINLTKSFSDKTANHAYRKKLTSVNVASITLPQTQSLSKLNNDSNKHLRIKSDSSNSSNHSEMINVSYHYFHHNCTCCDKSQSSVLSENSTDSLFCKSLHISTKENTKDLTEKISQSSCNLSENKTPYCGEFKKRLNLKFKRLILNSPLSLQFQVKPDSDICISNKNLAQSWTQSMINQPVCDLDETLNEKNMSRFLIEKHANDFLEPKKQICRKQVSPKKIVIKSFYNNWVYHTQSKTALFQQVRKNFTYPIINCSYLKHSKNDPGVILCKGDCFSKIKCRFDACLQKDLMMFNYKISPYPVVDLGQKCDKNYFIQNQSIQQEHLKGKRNYFLLQPCDNNSKKCNEYNLNKGNYKNITSTKDKLLKPSVLTNRRQLLHSLNKNVHNRMSQQNQSSASHSHEPIWNHLADEDVTKTNTTLAQSMPKGYNLRQRRKNVTCCNLTV